MTEVIRAAVELQAICEAQQWRYCFIGGLALQRWGEPRETVDVDLTLLTGFGGEERFIDMLVGSFEARIKDAAAFARKSRVLLLRAKSGVGLDIALGGLPFEESAVARSSMFAFSENIMIRTCSAEDLVVMKAFASRAKDWLDVEGVIVRQGAALGRRLVVEELSRLLELKEDASPMATLEKLFRRHR